jgi:hypothetical protein
MPLPLPINEKNDFAIMTSMNTDDDPAIETAIVIT